MFAICLLYANMHYAGNRMVSKSRYNPCGKRAYHLVDKMY